MCLHHSRSTKSFCGQGVVLHWLRARSLFQQLGRAGGKRSPQRLSRLHAAMSSNGCSKQGSGGGAAFSSAKKAKKYCAAGAAALAEAATRQAEAMLSHCCVSVACEYLLGSCNRVCCVVYMSFVSYFV